MAAQFQEKIQSQLQLLLETAVGSVLGRRFRPLEDSQYFPFTLPLAQRRQMSGDRNDVSRTSSQERLWCSLDSKVNGNG